MKIPDMKFTISLLFILLLPSFIFVALKQNSLAPGLLTTSVIIILINSKYILKFFASLGKIVLCKVLIFTVFSSSVVIYIKYGISKPILSFFVLLLILLSALVLSEKLKSIEYEKLESSIFIVILILFFFGWVNFFIPINFGAYSLHAKQVFPFAEESHYALSVCLLSVAYAITGPKRNIIFIIINMILLSFIFPSLTMLLASCLTLFTRILRLKPKYFKITLLMSPIIILFIFSILMVSNEYFANRLSFAESENLTTLVFLQGWYLAYVNTVSTNGLGLGFQMLGMPGTYLTPFSALIETMAGSILNIDDGGLLAAKLIAEFGFIGIIVSLIYCYIIIKFIFDANKVLYLVDLKENNLLAKNCLLHGLLLGFSIEFFFRGYGYFSPSLYLIVATLIAIRKTRILYKDKIQ